MRVIYMGTPEFAVNSLESLVNAGHEVKVVFTQPDKPRGRSGKMIPSEVKVKALEYDIPVYQPEKLRDEENVNIIKEINPDIIVVVAYGKILPESILNIPKFGCINVHASILPKLRGSAPIERSILNGDSESGVTIMYMEKGLDTGDIIEVEKTPILPTDTGAVLRERLAVIGAKLLVDTMVKIENGTAKRVKQNDDEATLAPMLYKEMGLIDFSMAAKVIDRQIRALIPWPVAYCYLEGKSVKIYEAEVVDSETTAKIVASANTNCVEGDKTASNNSSDCSKGEMLVPGMVIEVTKKSFTILCKDSALRIKKLQPEGKKCMDAASFLNGKKLELLTKFDGKVD